MYVNSHDLVSEKGETILDTKVYVMKLFALWLNHLFNRFLLSQLKTKIAYYIAKASQPRSLHQTSPIVFY